MTNQGKCDKCENVNEYSKTICDFCGARLPWSAAMAKPETPHVTPIPVTLTAKPLTADQKRNAEGCGKVLGIGCAGIVALFVILILVSLVRPKSPNDNKSLAYVVAREEIRRQLKSPSTAVFPRHYEQGVAVARLQDNSFAISSYVDSQNSFGAQLRSRWVANVSGTNSSNMVVNTSRVLD